MASEASQDISLKILVEREKNRVVFVESNNVFIDIMFSFMTMPIGKIVELSREHLLKGEIGCLNNLYESVESLSEQHLRSEHKDILLHPRSATEIFNRKLKLNLSESENSKYYVCPYYDSYYISDRCNFLSYYRTTSCRCGRAFSCELNLLNQVSQDGEVFVKPNVRFMITDDFQVLPMSTMTGLSLLRNFGAVEGSKIEERTLHIGKIEVLKLLRSSLESRTPFSDTFMNPTISRTSFTGHCGKYGWRSTYQSPLVRENTNKDSKMNLKLIINRRYNTVLYAEVEENFVDVLCSFLAFPIGYVLKEFSSLCFEGCMGNLYESIKALDVHKFFNSELMKADLVDPKLPPGLAYGNELIGIEEAAGNQSSLSLASLFTMRLSVLNSNSYLMKAKIGGGFMEGPSMFMVTDNLSITPLSPISSISLINKLEVPLGHVGELEVTMGEEEALRLLGASLVSNTALTDTFMPKEPKIEQ